MPVRRKVFRIEEMNVARRSGPPHVRGMRALDHAADAINHAIVRTKQEITAFHTDGSARALRELAAVADGTEAATQRILTATEEIDEAANSLSALVKQTQPQALAHDIRDQVIRIFEACNFQDLAGQRIAKIVTALNLIEAHNARMMEIWGGVEAFRDATATVAGAHERNNVPTNGPKLDGDAGHASQEEIDAMFGERRIASSE